MKLISIVILAVLSADILTADIIRVPADRRSIQAGIDAAAPVGDTVLVSPGLYREHVVLGDKHILVGSHFILEGAESFINETVIDGGDAGRPLTFNRQMGDDVTISGFTVRNGRVSNGSGVYCDGSSPTLDHLVIENCEALADGGAIYCTNSASPRIIGCKILSNLANEQGGGLYCSESSNPTLTDVEIIGNASSSGAGINCRNRSSPRLSNVLIADNQARTIGGGILLNVACNASLTRVALVDNTAASMYAGGIFIGASDPVLDRVTISQNLTEGRGGGIYLMGACRPNIVNTIVWNNATEEAYYRGNPDPPGVVAVSYSDVDGGQNGFVFGGNGRLNWLDGNIDADPLFANAQGGDYHLTGSPCIDAGDPRSAPDPDGSRADIGAYYYDFHNVEPEPAPPLSFLSVSTFPNPTNGAVTINIRLAAEGRARVDLFDLRGALSASLFDGRLPAGSSPIIWQSEPYGAGIYLLRATAAGLTATQRLIVIK